MKEAPEPVLLYIPLMKELNLSWTEIKSTPRFELEGILMALGEYNRLHSLDGYDSEDINEMAKNKPSIRSKWAEYQSAKAKYYRSLDNNRPKSFKGLFK
jgi:hypothetical protein|tara:strand:+ start:1054 stop:1350 length:297 start_codon:yes stop_codon:yes gene_type:complete